MAEQEKETVHIDETESTETKASKKEKKSKQQITKRIKSEAIFTLVSF